MRIWGYVLLTLGIISLIFFGYMWLEGGDVELRALAIAVLFIVTGFQFVRSGGGILEERPSDLTEIADRTSPSRPLTAEVPMSPQVAAVIKKEGARTWRVSQFFCGGMLLLFAGFFGVLWIQNAGKSRETLRVMAPVMFGIVLFIYAILWLTTRMPVLKDMRAASYLRTTGPVEVVRTWNGAILRLPDRAFLVNGRRVIEPLRSLDQGTVDYTPHGHLILAAWDSQGSNVYRAPGYDADYGS